MKLSRRHHRICCLRRYFSVSGETKVATVIVVSVFVVVSARWYNTENALYFDSTYAFFDFDFIDFCNVMLVLCVYFRYLSVKGRRASKLWNIVKKGRKKKLKKEEKKRLKSQKSCGKSKPDQFFPHFQKQLPTFPAFSPSLRTQLEALSNGFLPINRPSRISSRHQAF